MKINEVIRERRLAKRLTQEQMAKCLGVTTPAVNKWEKGISYPDITLLPALARLLDTDLNTLLSFKDELTEQEIVLFLNNLSQIVETDGFEKAYSSAMEKLKEYPTCYPLLLNVAMFLDGAVALYGKKGSIEEYRATIESLYQRVLYSQDSNVRNWARSRLISRYMERKEYDKAQGLLNQLPEETPVDKKQLQADLFIACDRLDEAARLEEEKLLSATNEIHAILISLIEIAIKEDRIKDAEYIAGVSQKGAKLFDLWEYSSYIAHFQLYSACKNRIKCLRVLIPMLKSLTHAWEINKSPLYRHIKSKQVEKGFGDKMRKRLIQSIRKDDDLAFLQESKEFQDTINEIDIENENESQVRVKPAK